MSLKIRYKKKIINYLSERDYAEFLQKFIYESKGCITGWNRINKDFIEFSCEL